MDNELRFDGRVAIVTGAGAGLGRSHALALASRGCKVVVNDLGGSATGSGQSTAAADRVVEEIRAAGGEAVANHDSVEDGERIVKTALDAYGRIDILINNAGILRDVSFQKMTDDDWGLVYRVHLLGSYRVTRAAWETMREAGYGRILFTSSAAGIYGNFGQANYSAMKLGLVGLSNTLALEGRKRNILVNTIAPLAGSRLTETVLPKEVLDALRPEYVSPLCLWLCHENSKESGGLYEVGGGVFMKLRWQRARGKTFKLGRNITPELLQQVWPEVTGFDDATFPTDISSSMQPVMANLSSKSKGGNQLIDADEAIGAELPEMTSRYDERDLEIYALGVGAGKDALDPGELKYVYDLNPDGFYPLPTFGVVPALNVMFEQARKGQQAPGMHYGLERILHGEQYTELRRPLPTRASLTHKTRIRDIYDKGKNAIVVTETRSFDESGEELIYNQIGVLVRGAGGFGGDRGPSAEVNLPPERPPDAVESEVIGPNQALLYRLSGDFNPLHADPEFAKGFGFPRPILHGLCTFGHAGRHVIKSFAQNEPRLFRSIKVRFSDIVFPGETLITEMWKESDTRIVFRCKVKERDKVVISNAAVELWKEIPQPKPKAAPATAAAAGAAAGAAPAAASAPAAPAEPTTRDIFLAVRNHIAAHPEIVGEIGTSFQIKLSGPDASWGIDVKSGKGEVVEGALSGPDVTLEFADADFLGMALGKLNPQKLYFSGKLKISGNVMASQKLEFLKRIKPEEVMAVMRERGAGAGGAPAGTAGAAAAGAPTATAAAPSPDQVTSADIFAVIADYVAHHPELVGQVGSVFQFKLSEPDSAYYIDLKSGKGAVGAGMAEKSDCTLDLSDQNFLAMTAQGVDPQKLYFAGKLKISGNIMASQKLMFLKKIDPKSAEAVIVKARQAAAAAGGGAGQTAAAAAPAKKEARAKAVFAALAERIAKTPGLVGEVAAVVEMRISDPDSAWLLDLRAAPGSVSELAAGAAPAVKPDTVLKLAEADLLQLVAGHPAQDLFQRGQLLVEGAIRPAHKLGLLRQLV